ncbi:MAG: choice-of-anchor D domain-containing protein [Verrucomicrobia bacterium]|nr:choice-of-anchor D domain-containing protein [Verrucomicrobiota bacterium]
MNTLIPRVGILLATTLALLVNTQRSLRAAPGDLDPLNANVVGSYVMATAVQPDGKTIIAGLFSSVLGQPRNNIARLNADGTLDTGFDPNANNIVYSVAVQVDGKILLGGNFTSVGGTGRNRVARVTSDGTVDPGFNPNASSTVYSVAVQVDGKILFGGNFTSVGGAERNYSARVAADGALDMGFSPAANSTIYSVVLQADGKILLGGYFSSVSGTGRNNIARVASDGTLDMGFNPNPDGYVNSVAVQADGKILLGGSFSSVGGTARSNIARVSADGTLDIGFNPDAGSFIYSVAVQADGKILLGGNFTSVGGAARNRIARVAADGTLDMGFNPNANNRIYSVAVQADGKILLGGLFTTVSGTGRNFFARMLNDPATQTLSAPDTSLVTWTRGGSAPEISQTTFELSTDGGTTYTSLAGTAIHVGSPATWQLAGLSLPTSGQLRARGRTLGGNYNGSSGLVEAVTSFSGLAPPAVSLTHLTPARGSTGGITSVTLTGTGFTGATAVTFGGASATSVVVVNDTSITATTPAHAAGAVSVVVTTPSGSNAAYVPYTYVAPPTLTASSARLLTTATTLTLNGTGFDAATPGNNTIVFTPAGSGTVTAATATSLTVTSLSGLTPGALNAVVTTNAIDSGAAVQVASVVVPGPVDLDTLNANVVGSYVMATAVQPDGKTIIAGSFSSVLGQPRNNIARLNADGTLDSDFNPNANNIVYSVAVQADGKILLGGNFTSVGGVGRNRIAGVAANGTLDAGFNPNASGPVYCVAVQGDGKILLGGDFSSVGGVARNRIARVTADGTLDAAFNLNASGTVYSVVVQVDGKILLGGQFTSVGGTGRNNIARVAADGTLDTGFNPNASGPVYSVTVQMDGNILLDGQFTSVGGTARNSIAGVAVDGTLDLGFNPNASGAVYRVAADGTLDAGFNLNMGHISNNVFSVAVQADGQILLGGDFTTVGGTPRRYFARLVNDPATQTLSAPDTTQVTWIRGGSAPEVSQVTFELSTDGGSSFTPLAGTATRLGSTVIWQLGALSLPTSGQLRARGRTVGGYYGGSSGLVEKVASFSSLMTPALTVTAITPNNGSTAGGTSVTITGTGFTGATGVMLGGTAATSFTVIDDTQITATSPAHAAGRASVLVSTPGGTNSANTLYTYISPPTVTASTADLITSATTVTITGTGFDAATPGNNSVVFTPEGSGTVTAATGTSLTVTSLSGLTLGALNAVVTTNGLSSGAAVQVATVVVPPPGTLDSLDANVVGGSATVYATAVQPDGKTIIAGSFSSVLGQPRNNIARLNADGTLDAGFNPNANNTVYSLAVQPDGQILLGGNFTSLGGAGRNRIARVAADGTLDTSFNPNASGTVYCVAIQADGKILLGGDFTTVGGTVRNRFARVASNGMLDTGFNPNANSAVYCVALQADGKILLGGHFTTVGGTARNRIARVAANGTPDTGFYPNPYGRISSVAVQADGKILLAGYFTSVGGTARNSIARVAANGTLDASFNPDVSGGGSDVNSVAVQADGKILLGGNFTTVGGVGRNCIARVAADGTLDTGFNPNASSTVSSVAVQADGKILLGGNFTSVGGTGRNLFARLLNDPATQTLSVSSATQVTWTRGGSAPDVSQVTFEVSTDGGTSYTPLGGTATRVGSTPNWQLTGLSLPSSGQLRAFGRTTNGYQNGSSGLVEQVQAFVFPPEMVVSGNSVEVTDGDSMPSVADHTDFGNVNVVGGSLVRSFSIANSGGGTVNLTGTPKVAISGTNAADFSVNVQPTTPVAAGGGTTFQVTFVPSAVGLRSATLSIANDDSDENPYDFSIQGTGDTFGGNLAFAPVGYTVTEGGMATLTINRSESTSGEVAVTVATSILTVAPSALATVTKDYTAKVQVLTFANGESSKTFDVLTQTDTLVESNETFLVKLSAPTNGAVLGSAVTARVTIIDPSATLPTDITLPAITLTTPALNALVGVNTGGSMNLIGTATDGKGVRQVEYRFVTSGGPPGAFTLATLGTPGGNSTSFTAPITPVTGTNTVEVKVTDYKGNIRSLARTFKVTRPLQVILAGTGTVSTGLAGTSFREVGKPFTITATPGMGHVFDGWLASNTAGTGITPLMLELPKLTFTFTEGLVLTAKFIPNPFTTSLVGTFNGLALPSGATTPGVANVGLLSNLVLDTKGSFTSSLKIDGVSLSTPGFFDNAGVARFSVTTRATTLFFKRTGKPDIELALNLNMTPGSGKLSGTVTQKIGAAVQAVSNIDADRAHYSTANKLHANLAGVTTKPYTLVFPAKTQSPVKPLNLYPQGDGYATMTVNVNGTVSLTGRLADDTPIIASAPLSKLNLWPLFAQLYTLKGSIAGMAALSDANGTTEDVIGTNLQWFRPALTGVQYYPAGWPGGITVDVNGARYVVPPASSATSVFPGLGAVNTTTGNATLTFTGGLLTSSVTKDFNISATNVISKLGSPVDATYGLLLIPATGVIGGAVTTFFTHSDLTKPPYKGVVIQKGSKQGGCGFFLSRITPVTGLGESGKVQVLAK